MKQPNYLTIGKLVSKEKNKEENQQRIRNEYLKSEVFNFYILFKNKNKTNPKGLINIYIYVKK